MEALELPMWLVTVGSLVIMGGVLVGWLYHLHAKRCILRKYLEDHPERIDEI